MMQSHLDRAKYATDRVKTLKQKFAAEEIVKKGVYIVIFGENSNEFAVHATAITGTPVFKEETIIDKIVDPIPPQNYTNKVFGANVIAVLNRSLENLAYEYQGVVPPYLAPKKNSNIHIKDKAHLKQIVEDLFYEQVGAEFIAVLAAFNMVDYAVENEFDGDKIPILIQSKSPKAPTFKTPLAKMGKGSFLVYAGKESVEGVDEVIGSVNKTNVTKTLKQIIKENNNTKKKVLKKNIFFANVKSTIRVKFFM
jgi:hypothetical protein